MEIRDYSKCYNRVGRAFLAALEKREPGQNIVLSPYSILMLLGICASSAAGETREEIRSAIAGETSFGELQDVLAQLQFTFSDSGTFLSTNAVCVREDIRSTVPPRYEAMLDTVYGGRVFAGRDMVRDVNEWVRENTRDMIDGIADESMREMLACLLNAAAFEAEWAAPYEGRQVRKDRFNNADGSVREVDMLHSQERRYIESPLFTGFVKPYKNSEFSYMALLPKEEGAEALRGSLDSLDLTDLFSSVEFVPVNVTMPEYRYGFKADLSDLCRRMGIRLAFTDLADFSPLSSFPLKVDSILHKAFIQVDRKGTRAAAVTAAVMMRAMAARPSRPKEVRLDRPFLYAVVHNETGLPVFCGIVSKL